MFNKIIFICLLMAVIITNSLSQKDASEYEPPEIIEGNNLFISARPSIWAQKESSDTSASSVNYHINFGASYQLWRFTRKLDHTILAEVNGYFDKNESSPLFDADYYNSYFSINLKGSLSRYITKDKLYTGLHIQSQNSFSNSSEPYIVFKANPNVGYGRVIDAFVVNQARNIEDVLIRSGYISSPFNTPELRKLNNLLDKRDGNELQSKYLDDDEIEFFTRLEKLLLDEKIINKPLNAGTTMKIFQSLYNNKFVLYPLFRGWHVQAELGYTYINRKPDSLNLPVTLTLSGLYGTPLNSRSSLLISSAFAFPVNKNYNAGDYDFEVNSPVIIRSLYNRHRELEQLDYRFGFFYPALYDFKLIGQMHIFYNFSSTAGISGQVKYVLGKKKDSEYFNDEVITQVDFIYNILSKLRLQSTLRFESLNNYDYSFSLGTGISYIIF